MAVNVSAQERAHAIAAIARLRAQARVGGHYPQVTRQQAPEDSNIAVAVHVHVGPLGNGRTVIVEKQSGNALYRKMQGDDAYGMTIDWHEIDLTKAF